jgi:hypothetical protein
MSQSPAVPPAPPTAAMSVDELDALVRAGGPHRGKAAFALIDRVPGDAAAVEALGELAKLPSVRADRRHMITLAWAMIVGLLAGETPRSRELAYVAFAELAASEQESLLAYLKVGTIVDAHPDRP